jgi:hypothetical protein
VRTHTRFYCFGCWQAWEKKDADAGRSKADIGSLQAAAGAAEQAGQDQAEETQKRPQERTEVRKSRKAEEAPRKKDAKEEPKKLQEDAAAAAAASEASLEAVAKATLEAMGFVVTPQVRELIQSSKYQVDAVVTEILRLQEQEEQTVPAAATGASSHASASYFEQLKLSTACAAHSAGSASESMPERSVSPAEAAGTGGKGREGGREGGRGTANESAVLAPVLQIAARAQAQGVPTAVLAPVLQETEALKQKEEPYVKVSSSRHTSHADQMEVLGARGPVHRSAEPLVRSGGGGAAGGARAAGGASSPGDVAPGMLSTHTHTHTHTHTQGAPSCLYIDIISLSMHHDISIHGYYTSCY